MFGGSFPEPREFQHAAHESLRQGARDGHRCQMLMAPTGAGKCLAIGTPVLMYDGSIKAVETITAGELVMGPDGASRLVTSIATGYEQMYQVTQAFGDDYTVNESHILSLRHWNNEDEIKNISVLEYLSLPRNLRQDLQGWRVPDILKGNTDWEATGRISVQPVGFGTYYGFTLEGPDRLFLLGDFTVTHNTYLGLRIAHEANKKGRRAIFMCDRQALINQTYSTAQDYGMSDIGVIMGQDWQRSNPRALLQIASAQTIQRRKWPDADVIIIDEAHTQMPAWVDHIPNTEAMVIGLSATPFSPGLGKLFSNLINATTMAKLTEQKVLVPMRVITCVKPDMVGAATSGSEWTAKAAGERGMEIVGDVVLEWKKHSENRKTIVFGSDIKHCEKLCQEFNEAGVMACLYTSKTTDTERREILKEFKKPNSIIRVLISVEALAKGFDVQDVGVVVDCRPLRKSLSTAIQMWGRGARSSSISEKNDFILIDHSGNFQRFAEDFENIYFNGLNSLDEKDKLDSKVRDDDDVQEPKSCPACGYSPFFKTCMSCGHEKVTVNTTEHEDGVGVEITTALTAKTSKDDKAERQAFYSQLIGYQQECGYSRGWSAHKYKEKFGVWPRGLTETPVMPSAEIARWIKSRNIRFAKGKEKRQRLTGATA